MYRVSLFGSGGHVIRGRVSVVNLSLSRFRFREMPAFSRSGGRAYEVLASPRGYVTCSLARPGSHWLCISEVGEGMGGMWANNWAVAPQAFVDGLSNIVGDFVGTSGAPYPLFLSRGVVDDRAVRCLSAGNPAGAIGRICTTPRGLIVSYRLTRQFSPTQYASAELVSYSPHARSASVRPPAKPLVPGATRR
jgi:hypothetical protein